jgi:hypothetical protein
MSFSNIQYIAIYLPLKEGSAFATIAQASPYFPATVVLDDGHSYYKNNMFITSSNGSSTKLLQYCSDKNIRVDIELPS